MRRAIAFGAGLAALVVARDPIVVKVGEVGGTMKLAFDPPAINVTEANTVVTFIYDGVPGNHTVAQSSFSKPCEPLEGGFNSGFVFYNDTSTEPAQWNLTVTDTSKPIWFFCAQQVPVVHCTKGMVGAINAPAEGNTFDVFLSQAQEASSVVFPSTTALAGVGAFASKVPATTGISTDSAGQSTGQDASTVFITTSIISTTTATPTTTILTRIVEASGGGGSSAAAGNGLNPGVSMSSGDSPPANATANTDANSALGDVGGTNVFRLALAIAAAGAALLA